MNDASEFHVEKVEMPDADAVVYRMTGVLSDTHSCYEFLEEFKTALPTAPARILFNLEHLENMYSAGVGIVATAYTQAKKVKKSVLLVGVPRVIRKTLTITALLPLVKDYPTEDEALAAALD